MTVVVSGSLAELRVKADALRRVVDVWEASGIDMFHPDMRWLWATTSGAPCARCAARDGEILSGDMIPITLPHYRVLGLDEIHPEYHRALGWRTPCYCRLRLQNLDEVAREQLRFEMERAAD